METIFFFLSSVLKIHTEIAGAPPLIWVARSEGSLSLTLSGLYSFAHHILPM